MPEVTGESQPQQHAPVDAKIIAKVIESMGVDEYEPGVVSQLLELLHNYVGDVLSDALDYAGHAGRNAISVEDARIAIESQIDSVTAPPTRETLAQIAAKRNDIPLPPIPDHFGLPVPEQSARITETNYNVVPSKRKIEEKWGWTALPSSGVKIAQTSRKAGKKIQININMDKKFD